MSLAILLKDDTLTARKASIKNPETRWKSSLLVTILAEAEVRAKNEQRELSENDVIVTLKKFKNNLDEVLKVSYNDQTALELALVESYLPKVLSKSELEVEIDTFLTLDQTEKSIKIMKPLISYLEHLFPGQIDNKVVAEILKS